jgi:hypothetical protein
MSKAYYCAEHKEKQNYSEKKPVSVLFCPPQIPHGLPWDGTQASTCRSWKLTGKLLYDKTCSDFG